MNYAIILLSQAISHLGNFWLASSSNIVNFLQLEIGD
jgi:hypothetical protein